MKYAVVENGVVTNIIVADEGFAIPGAELVPVNDQPCDTGWSYDGKVFAAPKDGDQ